MTSHLTASLCLPFCTNLYSMYKVFPHLSADIEDRAARLIASCWRRSRERFMSAYLWEIDECEPYHILERTLEYMETEYVHHEQLPQFHNLMQEPIYFGAGEPEISSYSVSYLLGASTLDEFIESIPDEYSGDSLSVAYYCNVSLWRTYGWLSVNHTTCKVDLRRY